MAVLRSGNTDLDKRLRVLADEDRRAVLAALATADPDDDLPMGLYEIAHLDPTNAEIRLRHEHLPMLAEEGFVAWNEGTDEIRRGSNFHEVEPLVDHLWQFYDDRQMTPL